MQNPMPTHPQPHNPPANANPAQVTTLTLGSEDSLIQTKQQVTVDELDWLQGHKPAPLKKVE